MKKPTIGDKCIKCHHIRGDHAMFMFNCWHIGPRGGECRCSGFQEPTSTMIKKPSTLSK